MRIAHLVDESPGMAVRIATSTIGPGPPPAVTESLGSTQSGALDACRSIGAYLFTARVFDK